MTRYPLPQDLEERYGPLIHHVEPPTLTVALDAFERGHGDKTRVGVWIPSEDGTYPIQLLTLHREDIEALWVAVQHRILWEWAWGGISPTARDHLASLAPEELSEQALIEARASIHRYEAAVQWEYDHRYPRTPEEIAEGALAAAETDPQPLAGEIGPPPDRPDPTLSWQDWQRRAAEIIAETARKRA